MVALALALAIAGWVPMPANGIVAAYRGPGGAVLAVTRAQVPNPDAWRGKTRDAYLEQIERGALAQLPGAKRLAHHVGEAKGVPTLDLELRAADGRSIVIRYLVFRTYVLAAAIELQSGADLAPARALATALVPATPAT